MSYRSATPARRAAVLEGLRCGPYGVVPSYTPEAMFTAAPPRRVTCGKSVKSRWRRRDQRLLCVPLDTAA